VLPHQPFAPTCSPMILGPLHSPRCHSSNAVSAAREFTLAGRVECRGVMFAIESSGRGSKWRKVCCGSLQLCFSAVFLALEHRRLRWQSPTSQSPTAQGCAAAARYDDPHWGHSHHHGRAECHYACASWCPRHRWVGSLPDPGALGHARSSHSCRSAVSCRCSLSTGDRGSRYGRRPCHQ
jgi:hypothetical protein